MPACTSPPRPFLPAYSGHFLAPPQPPAEPSLFSGPTLPVQTLVQYGIPHQTVTPSSLNQKLRFPTLRVSHAPKRCTRYTRERYRRGLVNHLSGVSSPWPRKQLGSGQAGSVGLLPALPLLPPGSRAERNGTGVRWTRAEKGRTSHRFTHSTKKRFACKTTPEAPEENKGEHNHMPCYRRGYGLCS